MLQNLRLEDIPVNFDEQAYVIAKPEARAFQKTFCQLNGIPDRVRLYAHFLTYSDLPFDFSVLRSLFTRNDYERCYSALVSKLSTIIAQKSYYPLGFWLVESASHLNKHRELEVCLSKELDTATKRKCLAALGCQRYGSTESRFLIFYAFNENYIDAFKVSIASLVAANRELLPSLFFVFGFDLRCNISLKSFLDDLGIVYEILDTSIYTDLPLKEEYGTESEFTLDRSAYYRIFVLRDILNLRPDDFQKALYLDADTLVVGELVELLHTPLKTPLAAKAENYSVERIKLAKARSDINLYFNSGVLLFDLKNPTLEGCLAETIDVVFNRAEDLIMHDQCALNIGFNGSVTELPAKYNYMLHAKEVINLNDELVVLHFTGRLKPWQNSYQDDSFFKGIWDTYYRLVVHKSRQEGLRVVQ